MLLSIQLVFFTGITEAWFLWEDVSPVINSWSSWILNRQAAECLSLSLYRKWTYKGAKITEGVQIDHIQLLPENFFFFFYPLNWIDWTFYCRFGPKTDIGCLDDSGTCIRKNQDLSNSRNCLPSATRPVGGRAEPIVGGRVWTHISRTFILHPSYWLILKSSIILREFLTDIFLIWLCCKAILCNYFFQKGNPQVLCILNGPKNSRLLCP